MVYLHKQMEFSQIKFKVMALYVGLIYNGINKMTKQRLMFSKMSRGDAQKYLLFIYKRNS